MTLLLTLLALVSAGTFLSVLVGFAIQLVERGEPVVLSRPEFSLFLREWASHVLCSGLLLFGWWGVPPRPGRHDDGHPPVVLVPGFMMNRGCFALLMTYLRRRGWRWVWGVNNRPLSSSIETYARALDRRVGELRQITGADKVDVVGHSMGGVIAAYYINVLGGADHVRRLVTINTPWQGTRMHVFGQLRQSRDLAPGSDTIASIQKPKVETLGLWSRSDHLVVPAQNGLADGVTSFELAHAGHVETLLSARGLRMVADLLSTEPDAVASAGQGGPRHGEVDPDVVVAP